MSIERLRAALTQNRTAIMGVVNTTPDSFSDGGKFLAASAAVEHALELVEQGADIIDIGGESTRPGARPVTVQEELDRVIPVIEAITERCETPVSVDTSKSDVMSAALKAGAAMINDVGGLRAEGAIEVVAKAGVPVCVMHMQGEPRSMQHNPSYQNVVAEVCEFFQQRIDDCTARGIAIEHILIDPGIGFGKTLEHNLSLLAAIPVLRSTTGCEVLIGVSRKSMIDQILKRPVEQRMAGSIGLAVQAVLNGARIVRVHDVAATHDAIRCVEAVASAGKK